MLSIGNIFRLYGTLLSYNAVITVNTYADRVWTDNSFKLGDDY